MKFKDFYDVEYPDILAELGFADESYHNDCAGHLHNEKLNLSIWVCDEKRENREHEGYDRYSLIKGSIVDVCCGEGVEALSTEWLAPIVAAIKLEISEQDHARSIKRRTKHA